MGRVGIEVNYLSGEVWKQVPHKQSKSLIYASNRGRLKKIVITKKGDVKEYLLKEFINERNYPYIKIRIDNIQFTAYVNKLVLSAFNYVDGFLKLDVINLDKNTLNNNLNNLQWANRSQLFIHNNSHPFNNPIEESKHLSPVSGEIKIKLTKLSDQKILKIVSLRKKKLSQIEIAKELKISQGLVSMVLSGKRRQELTEIKPKRKKRRVEP